MKIIVATPLFPPEIEGVASYSQAIAKHLKDKNQVQILAYTDKFEKIEGVEIFSINKKQPLFFRLLKYFIKLYQLAKKADVIYVQNSAAVTLPVLLLKRLTKKPVVLNFIEDEVWKRAQHNRLTKKTWEEFLVKPEIDKKIEQIFALQKQALLKADKIVFSSQALAQAVTKSYNLPAEKSAVNYLPFEKIELPFEQNIKKNQILVFGQDLNIAGQEINNDCKFIVLGNQLLSKAEISYLINTSALIIYNVQSENFDNFLIDCVVAGKNILAGDTSYTREILGQSGMFIDFNNKKLLVEKIQQLLNNKENKNTNNRFTWQSHVNKLQEIFEASVKK